jgi:hypothetical protein
MTENQWVNCSYPLVLLEDLRRASRRKLRLLGCACCCQVWALLSDERSRQAVRVAEEYADGLIDEANVNEAFANACTAIAGALATPDFYFPHAAAYVAHADAWYSAHFALQGMAIAKGNGARHRRLQLWTLHDIFGNPFRPITINPAWLTPAVVSLAHAVYDGRTLPAGNFDPVRVAVLADALEEVAADWELVEHLRGPGTHLRGCWVVDLLRPDCR